MIRTNGKGSKVDFDNAHLKACNDSNFWCCESDTSLAAEKCCNKAFNFMLPVGNVIAQLQSSVGAIPLAASVVICKANLTLYFRFKLTVVKLSY